MLLYHKESRYNFLFIVLFFWAIITFWEFLVFLESHGRAEYYNGKYFVENILEKKRSKVEENEDEKFYVKYLEIANCDPNFSWLWKVV